MKKLLFIFFAILSTHAFAQNVGVNKTNPGQALDVNGNVNVDGKIMVNATAGQNGQVLRTNASGATEWANLGTYTYVVNFTQSDVFTIPAGITRILIEAWGAGGGGSSGGGGAAGMYIFTAVNVVPGATVTISPGTGGGHATTNPGTGTQGGVTTVTGSFGTLSAAGGNGAFATAPGYAVRYGTSGSGFAQYIGQGGDANTVTYAQKNTTVYTIIRKYGDGGAAGPGYSLRSQGESVVYNENTGTVLEANSPTFAPFPGGGGGGGILGEDGSGGMVVIRY